MLKRCFLWIPILLVSFFLSACDSAEERAQDHYETGMALLEEGDVDRALVEFRNVFKLNGTHKEARIAYAGVQEDRGDVQGAYGQYLRLVEQYPDNLVGRRALARIAADLNNWEEVERHVTVAERLAPEDPVVQSVRAGLDYRNGLRDKQPETAALAVRVSENLLQDHPDLPAARRVVIDDMLRRQDWNGALAAIDAGLETTQNQALYVLRLGVLEKLGRTDEIITQLQEMVDLFPNAGLHHALVNRYIAENRLDDAQAYLRDRVARGVSEGGPEARLELIAFLAQRVSREAAFAEIDRILAETDDHPALFRSVRAGLDFDSGNTDAAIMEMEDVLKDAEPSEETDRIKIALAQMLIRTGNPVGARAHVEEVLEHDPSQIDALKLKAVWLIEDDRPGDALVDLRMALDQAPRDPALMTLMAQAHERAGDRDLMGEMLALAVEASRSAPTETLRYAQFLVRDGKLLPAEDVLQAALRLQNTNPSLLAALGNVYIQMEDWPRTQHVITTLERLDTEQGQAVATELTARMLAGRNQTEELETLLSGLANSDSGLQAAASIIRLRLAQGDIEGAQEYANSLIEQDPENPILRFLQAGSLIIGNRTEEAAVILEGLVADVPQNERFWLALYRLHRRQGAEEKAAQILSDAQVALPDNVNLKWVAAGEAERKGDIETAIAIYESVYAANSGSMLIANNLASLISSYQDDDESLQRAYGIARRLRGTDVPAFQDTYGWIAHRLGNYDEAVGYLEPAAKALTTDPTVQYHLAETYVALGRGPEALEYFQKAAALMQDGRPRLPFMDRVDAEIARLSEAQN